MTAATSALEGFWVTEDRDTERCVFAVQGVRCANCVRGIERAVRALPGIVRVSVNVATARATVEWRRGAVDIRRILEAIKTAGFKPLPLAGEAMARAARRERRVALKRIGLAGVGMMQAMMYVLGVYVAKPGDIDAAMSSFLVYTGMLITTPVLFYSGAPFLAGAWRGLRERSLNMDFTVALALLLAYAASVFNMIRGQGQTYFDSVAMFVFFLSVGRYVEMRVRQRSLAAGEALGRSLPAFAIRLRKDGGTERIELSAVAAGDRLSIARGAVIPVDAWLEAGSARLDESLMTGEATPVRREAGEPLLGGSINTADPIVAVARGDVAHSTLASIVAMLEQAQTQRPRLALLADKIAGQFVAVIVLLAMAVAAAWLYFDSTRAFAAALAVLVVTCPCALSLATPAAVAAATLRLARHGLLVTRADALERLAATNVVLLDKTGTLTNRELTITAVFPQADISRERVLTLAAALERESLHPIARAFATFSDPAILANGVREHAGRGIEGTIGGERWRLGSLEFAGDPTDSRSLADGLYLGKEDQGLFARIELGEEVRSQVPAALDRLKRLAVTPMIASGDRPEAVQRVARELGIEYAEARLSPQAKRARVEQLQREGLRVLAVGDGVNDGPLLAAANVSCAMGEGSAIAQSAADILVLNDSLESVACAIETARTMRRIIRQNLRWALIYNFAAVPLAALALIPPWLAAMGMSMSSLVVVLNAGRFARARDTG